MVAKHQVRVQLDVAVPARLDGCVSLLRGGGGGDFGKYGACWERDKRGGAAAEGFWGAVNLNQAGMGWLWGGSCCTGCGGRFLDGDGGHCG